MGGCKIDMGHALEENAKRSRAGACPKTDLPIEKRRQGEGTLIGFGKQNARKVRRGGKVQKRGFL